jgi:mycofactocin precursor
MTVTTTEESVPSETGHRDAGTSPAPVPTPLVTDDLLVEDVSIDGMCGVY